METLFLNYMNSVHLSKWHYQLIFYIYLIVYVFFYFLFLIFYFYDTGGFPICYDDYVLMNYGYVT